MFLLKSFMCTMKQGTPKPHRLLGAKQIVTQENWSHSGGCDSSQQFDQSAGNNITRDPIHATQQDIVACDRSLPTEAERLKNKVHSMTSPAIPRKIFLPEPPTTCCMSGCHNCVWINYAEELAKYLQDDGAQAKKDILNHVQDQSLRAFLIMELDLKQ